MQDWFLGLSNLRVLALLVAILLLRKALHMLGRCCGSLPTLVDYQSLLSMMPLMALMLHKCVLLGMRRRTCPLLVLRALSFIAATQSCTCFQHAPAHSGDPWNELADVAVDYFCKPGVQVVPPAPAQRLSENTADYSGAVLFKAGSCPSCSCDY